MADDGSKPNDDDKKPGDDLDQLVEDSPQDAREWFRHKAQTEGLKATYQAMLDVLNDKKAPAPARATASGLMLRAAGVFSKTFEEETEADGLSPDTMTAEQLAREYKRLDAKINAARRRRLAEAESEDTAGSGGVSSASVFD